MPDNLTESWHILHPSYHIRSRPNDDIGIPLVFLQRLDKESRTIIQARIEDYDLEYSKQLTDRFGTRFDVSRVVPHAYIRDGIFDEDAVHIFIRRLQTRTPECRSAIFIDGAAESDSCVVSAWQWPSGDDSGFDPIRWLRHWETITHIKIDFANDFTAKPLDPVLPPFEPPSFWSKDLTLCGQDKITILALTSLTDEELFVVKQSCTTPLPQVQVQIEVVKWQGGSLKRSDIYQIFQWLESNKKNAETLGFAFFLDYLFRDEGGRPQVLAASRTSGYGHYPGDDLIDLMPVKPDRLKDLWYSALHAGEDGESIIPGVTDHKIKELCKQNVMKQKTVDPRAFHRCTNLRFEELVYNPRKAIRKGDFAAATVWFLRNFSLEEQRKVRALLSVDQFDGNREDGHAYMYMGYVFPDDGKSSSHKIDDLLQLFQKCEPYSPNFDPRYAPIRFNGYPAHFIVVDERIFDEDNPSVLVATTVDFLYQGEDLGWIIGTSTADLAHNAMDNLGIANMGPYELTKDAERMWLDDMKYFRPIYENADGDHLRY